MADLDVTQPNKGLELKFRAIILTYLLSFRKSILLLFLVYLLNLKKDSEAFQKVQSLTKQHRFNCKSQSKDRKNAEKITDSQQNDNDTAYEKQLNDYIRVIILLIAMFGGKGRLKSLLATLVKAELTAIETAIKCDLLQPVYCYVRNQGYAITLSMKNNLLKRGVNEFKADSLFSDSVPMLSYTDELGEVPPVPLPTPLMPVNPKQTDETINSIGRSIQDSVMASTDVIQQPPSIPDTTVPVNTGTAQQPYVAITEPEAVTPMEIVPPPPAEGIPAGKTGITPPGGGEGIPPTPPKSQEGQGGKRPRGRWLSQNSEKRLREISIQACIHAAKMTYRVIAPLVPLVVNWIYEGRNKDYILNQIENMADLRGKADAIVLQITLMTNQAIQRQNMLDLGFKSAKWIHVPGEFTSRKTHKNFNGQTFDLTEGLFDTDVQRNVFPCELWYCRCVMKGIIPKELL